MIGVLEDWTEEVCAALGLDADVVDLDLLLDLSRDVAHAVERRAAPVTTFLVGLAAGREPTGDSVAEATDIVLALLETR